jgi:glycosyltransferase involved in cell wall biosynthesis
LTDNRNFHFFNHHSVDASDWPFYKELRRLIGEDHAVVLSESVNLQYSRRWKLVLIGWPLLIWSTFRLAIKSARQRQKADFLVVEEHFQLWSLSLVYFLLRLFGRTGRPVFVYLGFIYTPRESKLLSTLRRAYFAVALRMTDVVVVYSELEMMKLGATFSACRNKFRFVHLGIGEHESIRAHTQCIRENGIRGNGQTLKRNSQSLIFSAGRSSRDYSVLAKAVDLLRPKLRCVVVCDSYEECPSSLESESFVVLRDCYGNSYTQQLVSSDLVVIPLRNPEISAGQMVAIHALAAGKPLIISDTPITREYFQECYGVGIIRTDCPVTLAKEIEKVVEASVRLDGEFEMIRHEFESKFSVQCYANRLYRVLSREFLISEK